jgi:DNA modification methylase
MKYETATIASLMLDPANVRTHDSKNLEAIKASLARFGQQKPIVVDAKGIIVAGNGTMMAAKMLNWSSVEIVRTNLEGAEAIAYAIADNRTAELAGWDEAALAQQLAALQIDDEELANIAGFTDAEIEAMILDGKEIEEDEVPEPPAVPITKAGDLWLLGTHRVLCGDSTNSDDVARLMDGAKAQMMFTDPPYGVNYEGGHFHTRDGVVRKREKLEADSTADIYSAFLPVASKFVDGACYIWFAGSKSFEVYSALKQNNYEIHSLLIWNKTNAQYSALNSQYKPRHEPFVYCKPKGSTLRWCGATTEATVWDHTRDNINEFHPTQKPVALAAKAIRNHEADSVLDLFLGSGSTLIAAEQLNRKCYGMEISPAYCDVIVKRWETLTGKTATLST